MVATIGPLVKVAPRNWLASSAIYAASSTAAGATAGFSVGLLGAAVGLSSADTVPLLVSASLALAILDTKILTARIPGPGSSVPRAWWTRLGSTWASALYGAVLGIGLTTVIPVASFYMLALAALALGPLGGLAVGATYGFMRAVAVPVVSVAALLTGHDLRRLTDRLGEIHPLLGNLSATSLVAVALLLLAYLPAVP